jgi:hypothetical protein
MPMNKISVAVKHFKIKNMIKTIIQKQIFTFLQLSSFHRERQAYGRYHCLAVWASDTYEPNEKFS